MQGVKYVTYDKKRQGLTKIHVSISKSKQKCLLFIGKAKASALPFYDFRTDIN